MSDFVERAVVVIRRAIIDHEANNMQKALRTDDVCREIAQNVLKSLREPTPRMIESQLSEFKRFGGDVVAFARAEAAKVWTEMLDAELKVVEAPKQEPLPHDPLPGEDQGYR